jgi:acyl-CoA thioesterase-1
LYSGSIKRSVYCVIAALFVTACGSSSTPAAPTPPVPSPAVAQRIVVLGDSLAVSPSVDQSFPARLQARIASSGLTQTVINAGVSGDTSADGLRREDALLASDVGVLVLELGANDGLRGFPTTTLEDNLSAMIARAQQRNIRVLLCGMETPPTHGLEYSLAFHLVYPGVAQKFAVPLVPFLLAGVALDPELNGPDGVHPNAEGAQRIADTVWPYLRPLL